MFIDIVAWVPFDIIFDTYSNQRTPNNLLRLVRLGRLYRLIKITKIYKQVLSRKSNVKWCKKLYEYLNVHASHLRFGIGLIVVTLLVHLFAWLWFFAARYHDFHHHTWVTRSGNVDADTFTLYIVSVYWSLTTMTTVGFGDIYALTEFE